MKRSIPGLSSPFPTTSDIVPGQTDNEIDVFLKASRWLDKDEAGSVVVKIINGPDAARLVYVGILSRTAPKQDDYEDADLFSQDNAAWRDACSERQQQYLDEASARARDKRNAEAREAYATKVGRPVREYRHNSTDERKRELDKERQRRFLGKMSPEDRRKYERERKAAQRAAKQRKAAETATASHPAALSVLDE